jgi:hypothetical protein
MMMFHSLLLKKHKLWFGTSQPLSNMMGIFCYQWWLAYGFGEIASVAMQNV